MYIPHIINKNSLSVLINGCMENVSDSHPKYGAIKNALRDGQSVETIENLINTAKAIIDFANDTDISVDNGVVTYKGREINNVLTERIISLMSEGFDILPMVKFLNNLLQNPSKSSVQQLYSFLENKHLPLTEDGCFLAYKAVDSKYYSKTSGKEIPTIGQYVEDKNRPGYYKILNAIGEIIEFDRYLVDDNPKNHCSNGLHCGAMDYVKTFGYNTDKFVIVKVNPKDAVSVPEDHKCQKIRVCRYEVIDEIENTEKVLEKSCYNSDGTETNIDNSEDKQSDGFYLGSERAEKEFYDFVESEKVCPTLDDYTKFVKDYWSDEYTDGFANNWSTLCSNFNIGYNFAKEVSDKYDTFQEAEDFLDVPAHEWGYEDEIEAGYNLYVELHKEDDEDDEDESLEDTDDYILDDDDLDDFLEKADEEDVDDDLAKTDGFSLGQVRAENDWRDGEEFNVSIKWSEEYAEGYINRWVELTKEQQRKSSCCGNCNCGNDTDTKNDDKYWFPMMSGSSFPSVGSLPVSGSSL